MSVDQFASLVQLIPDIEQALEQQGEHLPRPVYVNNKDQKASGVDDMDHGKSSRGVSAPKQNIEATSDEDESGP